MALNQRVAPPTVGPRHPDGALGDVAHVLLEESGGTTEDRTAACLNFTRRWFYGPAAARARPPGARRGRPASVGP
ncbi:hypothetical protein DVA86_26810 [Streptomyces armeniacus]|uniref:Uncharacterized protein n=1 Tax=Streptomyces armeniacus TaxID=83291 RepID=A0A345XVP2_9ACTN|nr:hypothetical protein [Streptomyces armeniacus]AXK35708.1 hypothetical protein DVA86_26810 [Streptomyces armeniacus]